MTQKESIIDVLTDFNNNVTQETPQKVINEPLEVANEDANGKEVEPEVQWLIENKFQDNDEGKEKLIKSYREIVSARDKDRNQFDKQLNEIKPAIELHQLLTENPDLAQRFKDSVKTQEAENNKMPEKPEEYDILDESIEGTESYKWRKSYDEFLLNQGRMQAKAEVDNFKAELQQQREFEQQNAELAQKGLSSEQINSFRNFVSNPEEVNTDILLQVWASHTGQQIGNKQAVPAMQRTVSPASVPGSTVPAPKPNSLDKQADALMEGIMAFSNKGL
tara:strand:+ start:951 stop:1781 length:831 start_codon:yes stop_codon:yes gene_type:complete